MSCSSLVSAETLTYTLPKLGKAELILKEEQKLAIFSLFSGIWYGCQRDSGFSCGKQRECSVAVSCCTTQEAYSAGFKKRNQ